MNRYTDCVKLFHELETTVSKMEKVESREEIEKLQLEARNSFKSLMMKLPFIENDIHQFAMKQIQRITEAEAKSIVNG